MADPPAQITTEWTVHAQLTILRSDQPTHTDDPTATAAADADRTAQASVAPQPTSYSSSSTSAPGGAKTTPNGQPMRVVYKWSSDDLKAAGCNGRSGGFHYGSEQKYTSFASNSTNDSGCCPHPNTGHLTSETEAADCNPKCRSTCSIVLSACTDLYPTPAEDGSMAPPQYNTTATCVVTPSTGEIYRHCRTTPFNMSTSVAGGEHIAHFLSVKDAFCQTSEAEFKAKSEPRTVAPPTVVPQRTRSQRAYDYRRATESSLFQSNSLLSPNISFEEGTSQTPFSRQPSQSPVLIRQLSSPTSYGQTYSPTPNVRVHHTAPSATSTAKNYSAAKAKPKKSPRTVHIDVYCTGSEAEEEEEEEEEDSDDSVQSDADSSSSSYAQHHYPHHFHFDDDAASNSTPQTVLNANQIKLHHSRMTNRRELPRRLAINLANDQSTGFPNIKPGQLRRYILDQANAKDEIIESKQMLFSKHMGAGHLGQPTNDGARSHVQPSKFSFNRSRGQFCQVEPSEGGYSSNYPNSSRSTFRDPTCSSISSVMASSSAVFDDLEKFGPNQDGNVSNADSFEYENAADRARITQMELAWKNAGHDEPTKDGSSNKGWRSPEKERKFLLKQRKTMDAMQHQIREMTEEESPARCVTDDSNAIYNNVSVVPPRHHRILFTPNYESSARDVPRFIERSPSMTHDSVDQSNQCTRFGMRLETTRKKHFGPAKNPDCPCDHCRRYATERGAAQLQMRGRTMSMGEEQMDVGRRSAFWLTRH